ncbi:MULTISPECIES: DMT family transporter [unclassified Streptomyces]|uniref:DMT family transporter n=1 Tax=unclassified Streptomyces TaxID=2593676 RepID=UPI00081EB79E|nr:MULTISPECIES: DMT family transporter [unclassified Streptomyces]MYZ34557.1 EamA family transporter [Streptomyces sp. SID4917]SCF68232.1 Permease of the drug/metabolite transporter (DMT) superfamily [Streptomyces sp. MnatMP-M17]
MSTATPPRPGPSSAPATAPGPAPSRSRPAFDWRVRFAALAVIWGFSFLLIKVGTHGFAPFQVTFGRLLFGTAVLAVAMAVKRERLPRGRRTWAHLTVAAFLLNALPFSLFAYAELTIPSTLAGICNATSPLWGMALSLVALSEDRPTRRRVAGLGIGFLGVLTVLGAWQGFSGLDFTGTAMALLASLSYPVGWIYVRRTLAGSSSSHLALTGAQLLVATVQLALITPLFTTLPTSFPALPLLSVFVLGALGTGLAILLQYGVVAEVGPTTGTMVTYFIPVIATAAGVTLLDEKLTWNTPVGAVIILAGAALTQSRARKSADGRPKSAGGRSKPAGSQPKPTDGRPASAVDRPKSAAGQP